MKHLDLFSGIGGFALAAHWVWNKEHEIVGFCELDKYCQKVLNKHWPNVKIYEDIKKLNGSQFKSVDIVTGGFPCQSFSFAGKRKGKEDDRYLWPEMFRIIQETRPAWVLAENVTGIINLALDTVLFNLESIGYETETFVIPACGINAPHKRERVWILAYSDSKRLVKNEIQEKKCREGFKKWLSNGLTIFDDIGRSRNISNYIRENNGLSQILDESIGYCYNEYANNEMIVSSNEKRLKALGNAIVPQVAMVIMQAIKELDNF